jgi:hypothetical protein
MGRDADSIATHVLSVQIGAPDHINPMPANVVREILSRDKENPNIFATGPYNI